MSTRIKLTRNTITTRAEAEEAVRTIRELTIEKNRRMLDKEQAIQAVQEAHRGPLAKIDADLQQQTELLSHWAELNHEEFGKLKSIEMTHGTIGWRTGMPRLVKTVKDRWDQMIERIKSSLGPQYLRRTEEVNKERILTAWSLGNLVPSQLSEAKLKVQQDEVFYISPRIEAPENKQTAAG